MGPAVPNDIGHGFPYRPREYGILRRRQRTGRSVDGRLDAGGFEHEARVLQLSLEGRLSGAADRVADARQRFARDALDVADLRPGAFRIAGQQAAGELALDRDQRQAVAEDVVQVTGDPIALRGDGQRGELLTGGVKLLVGPPQGRHGEDRDPDDADREALDRRARPDPG